MSLYETTDMMDTNPKKYIGPKVDPKTGKILGNDGSPLLPDGSNFDDASLHTQEELPDEDKFLGAETPDEVNKKKKKDKHKKIVKEGLFTMDDFSSLLEGNDQTSYTKAEALSILRGKLAKLKENSLPTVEQPTIVSSPQPNSALVGVYRDIGFANFKKSRINEDELSAKDKATAATNARNDAARDRRQTVLPLPRIRVSDPGTGKATTNKFGLSVAQADDVASHAQGLFSSFAKIGLARTQDGALDIGKTDLESARRFALAHAAEHFGQAHSLHIQKAHDLFVKDPTDPAIHDHIAQGKAARAMYQYAKSAYSHYVNHGQFDPEMHGDFHRKFGAVAGAIQSGKIADVDRGESHIPHFLSKVHGLDPSVSPGLFRDASHAIARTLYDHDLVLSPKDGYSVRKNTTPTIGAPRRFPGSPLDRSKAMSTMADPDLGDKVAELTTPIDAKANVQASDRPSAPDKLSALFKDKDTRVSVPQTGSNKTNPKRRPAPVEFPTSRPSSPGSSKRDIKAVYGQSVSREGGSGESHEQIIQSIVDAAKKKQRIVATSKDMPRAEREKIAGGSARIASKVFHSIVPALDDKGNEIEGKFHIVVPVHLHHIDQDTQKGRILHGSIHKYIQDNFHVSANVHSAHDERASYPDNPPASTPEGQRTLSDFPEFKPGEVRVTGNTGSTLSTRTDVALGVPGPQGSTVGRVRTQEVKQPPRLTPFVTAGTVITPKAGVPRGITSHSGPGTLKKVVLKSKAMSMDEIEKQYRGGMLLADSLHNFTVGEVDHTPTAVRNKVTGREPKADLRINTASIRPGKPGEVSQVTAQDDLDAAAAITPPPMYTAGEGYKGLPIASREALARQETNPGALEHDPSVHTGLDSEGSIVNKFVPGGGFAKKKKEEPKLQPSLAKEAGKTAAIDWKALGLKDTKKKGR